MVGMSQFLGACVGGKDGAVGGFKVLYSLLNSGPVSQRKKDTEIFTQSGFSSMAWASLEKSAL